MKFLRDLRRGRIPADTGRPVFSSWEEVEPDPDDGSEDGDNSVHADAVHPDRPLHEGREGVE